MMKKGIAAILGLVTAALAAVVVLVLMAEDRQGPEIIFAAEPVYTGAEDTSYLLEGVTASDAEDGDVTDSLRVEKVQVNEAAQQVTIIYIAKDDSNNVTKVSKTVPSNGIGAQTEPETDGENADGEDAEAVSGTPAVTPEETPTPTPTPEVLTGEQENEAKIAALPAGCPAFYLYQYELELEVGSSFRVLSYVEEITDDEDSRDWLFQHIQVVGEVDVYKAGTYEVIYFVIDTDGNVSNEAVLTVTVK